MKLRLKNEECLILFFSFIISLLFYGNYIFPHYASDTYLNIVNMNNMDNTPINNWNLFGMEDIKMGRWGFAVLLYILPIFKIVPINNSQISSIISILFFTISLFYFMNKFRKKYFINKISIIECFIIAIPLFMNPLYSDWFQFPEVTPYFSFGLMLVTISSIELFLCDNKRIYNYIFILLSLFAVSIYQVVLNIFLILSIIFILFRYINETLDFKTSLRKLILSLIIYVFSLIIQLYLIKHYGHNARIKNDLLTNFLVVLKYQPFLWTMMHLGSKNYILILTTILVFINIMSSYLYQKFLFKKFFLNSLLFISVIFIIFSIHIASEAWFSHRSIVFFYAIPSILTIVNILNFDKKKNYLYLILIISITLLDFLYLYKTNSFAIDTFKNNAMDLQITKQISNKIIEYEQKNNIMVNKSSFKNDLNITWAYPSIFSLYDMNLRAWTVPWSKNAMLELNMNRKFEEIDMPNNIYNEYFKDKDWSTFSEEQVVIIGDTVYIMIY